MAKSTLDSSKAREFSIRTLVCKADCSQVILVTGVHDSCLGEERAFGGVIVYDNRTNSAVGQTIVRKIKDYGYFRGSITLEN